MRSRGRLSYWIDQICVNQDDALNHFTEKTQQIPLMKRVYQSATCVIADLGPATEEQDKALAYLGEISHSMMKDNRNLLSQIF